MRDFEAPHCVDFFVMSTAEVVGGVIGVFDKADGAPVRFYMFTFFTFLHLSHLVTPSLTLRCVFLFSLLSLSLLT